jgi:hypothetical protein
VYPSSDPLVNLKRFQLYGEEEELWYFDITAFGLQFSQELLACCATAIAELYPNSFLDEETNILHRILETYTVEMLDGMSYHPRRGIGLGYYEDLKTIVILSLLNDKDLASVYGDQGIVCGTRHVDEILRKYQFVIKPDKVQITTRQRMLWGGCCYETNRVTTPKTFSNNLLGAFSSLEHWERKNGLRSLYHLEPELYEKHQYSIAMLYDIIYGYEFAEGDCHQHLNDVGVLCSKPMLAGWHKFYKVSDCQTPESSLPLDLQAFVPRIVTSKHIVPSRISRMFAKKRRTLYRNTQYMADQYYRYYVPRIVYNTKKVPDRGPIPGWADVLYASFYGATTGSITYQLSPEELRLAALRQVYSRNPFEARARGGYAISTMWRGLPCPCQEDIELADLLSSLEKRDLSEAARADLYPLPSQAEDPIYYNTNLIISQYEKNKRNRSLVSNDTQSISSDDEYKQGIYKKVMLLHQDPEESLHNLKDLLKENMSSHIDVPLDDTSDHGQEFDDDAFYAEEILDTDEFE